MNTRYHIQGHKKLKRYALFLFIVAFQVALLSNLSSKPLFQVTLQAFFQVHTMSYNQERIAFPRSYHEWRFADCSLMEFFKITEGSGNISIRHDIADRYHFRSIRYDKGNQRAMIYEGGDSVRYIESPDITLYHVLVLLGYGRRGWGDNSAEDVICEVRIEECDQDTSVVGLLNTPLKDICNAKLLIY